MEELPNPILYSLAIWARAVEVIPLGCVQDGDDGAVFSVAVMAVDVVFANDLTTTGLAFLDSCDLSGLKCCCADEREHSNKCAENLHVEV
jgi:hypothetical protein